MPLHLGLCPAQVSALNGLGKAVTLQVTRFCCCRATCREQRGSGVLHVWKAFIMAIGRWVGGLLIPLLHFLAAYEFTSRLQDHTVWGQSPSVSLLRTTRSLNAMAPSEVVDLNRPMATGRFMPPALVQEKAGLPKGCASPGNVGCSRPHVRQSPFLYIPCSFRSRLCRVTHV